MSEPWDERRKDDDLSEHERRIRDGLQDLPSGGDDVETLEDQPETAWAVEGDTTVDPRVMRRFQHGAGESASPEGAAGTADEASGDKASGAESRDESGEIAEDKENG